MVTGLRRIAPACAGALVLVLAVGTARAADRQGTILSVDVAGKKLVVLDLQTSMNLDIGVSDQTQILTNAGKPLQLQDLKRGDKVGYTEVGGVAGSIRVNQGELKGVVSTIDLKSQKLTVIEDVTKREVEVVLSPNTRIETSQRKSLDLNDVKTGDGVAVVYSGAAPVEVVINSKPPQLTGHIKSIAGDMRSLVVTEIGSNVDVTVSITPKTTIVSNSGKSIGMNDLKKGDGVGIAHQSSVASMIVVNPVTAP
jgi:Cu/Ag efflux protein CusF